MADRKRTTKKKPAPRRRKKTLNLFAKSPFRRKTVEFKPDSTGSGWTNQLHLTHVQRDTLLKWGGYILLCVLLSMIQDVVMSRVPVFGATTDLVVAAILLITVVEGVDTGSVFVLLASLTYYFSGSSPGPYCIILLVFLGIGASMFRQLTLHRSLLAIVFCAGVALMLYEIGTCGIGIFQGLTHWRRIPAFLMTGGVTWAIMLALYPLIRKIGTIGGNTWKE